jgi:hypothetical protein
LIYYPDIMADRIGDSAPLPSGCILAIWRRRRYAPNVETADAIGISCSVVSLDLATRRL